MAYLKRLGFVDEEVSDDRGANYVDVQGWKWEFTDQSKRFICEVKFQDDEPNQGIKLYRWGDGTFGIENHWVLKKTIRRMDAGANGIFVYEFEADDLEDEFLVVGIGVVGPGQGVRPADEKDPPIADSGYFNAWFTRDGYVDTKRFPFKPEYALVAHISLG